MSGRYDSAKVMDAYYKGVAEGRRLERRAMQRAAAEDMRNGETISKKMYRRLWQPRTKPAKRKEGGR